MDNTAEQLDLPNYRLRRPVAGRHSSILTTDALAFVAELSQRFDPQRRQLLADRDRRQLRLDVGGLPDFPTETATIRGSDWRVAEIPPDLLDRRVEITGPVDRKMIINALNSGARVFMADFEDSSAPSWDNMIDGQVNLCDAVNRNIDFTHPASGKTYQLNQEPAVLMVRPRGLHLPEDHCLVDGESVSASLIDFALYLFHNHKALAEQGTGPYFYLPKLEHYAEAAWWNEVIDYAEDALGLKRGTVKVTVLIETLHAGFQMDEILYELREHIVGLNCGRWDYIFSYIKALCRHADRVLPDRAEVTMAVGFLSAYSKLLIKTCHRRGALAMGGMAAQIPIKGDAEANAAALAKVRADKQREAGNGHDGTWVAHPALIPVALEVFDEHMSGANQLDKQLDLEISRADLLSVPEGQVSERGVRENIAVAIQYIAAWLSGNGCVPINHLMEDAATAEISRAQLWQWARYERGVLPDGRDIDLALIDRWTEQELARLSDGSTDAQSLQEAAELLIELVHDDEFVPFLTLPAYKKLTRS